MEIPGKESLQMMRFGIAPLLIAIAGLTTFSPVATPQSATDLGTPASIGDSSSSPSNGSASGSSTNGRLDLTYHRPTEKTKLRNYLFDTFGPYPIAGAAILGTINQADKTPPEWGQGFKAFGERTGSDFGIAMVTTTTRYTLAKAFREDTLYYRCDCGGVFRRLGHAVISTVTARRGDDGHRSLSIPAIIAPYAGTMTAVYGWYPSRYGVKDGLRMGNYALLAFVGGNIAREFIYGGRHTLFRRGAQPEPPEPAAKSIP
jgi:hypothetical protein